jgi:mannose-1-phosphate guanylyltransferase
MPEANFKAILFSGGAGSRLWPLSRRARPKQFQPLVGRHSLFQLMVNRLEALIGMENIFVSTGEAYSSLVMEQIPTLPPDNILAEPEMRDTLAAVGYAVAVLDDRYPGSIIATLWGADHIVREEEAFRSCLAAAHELASAHDWIVKIDVRPTSPSSGLGYTEYGEQRAEASGRPVFAFRRQIEKPSVAEAERLLAAGNYLWNTGYIVWTAEKVLSLYRQHAPAVHAALMEIVAARREPEGEACVRALYASMPKLSIDKGIFEKMSGQDMVVMPAELGWGDIGAWDVLRDELVDLETGNAVHGHHIALDTTNCLIYGPEDKTVITIGVRDLIVVDTGDALLICPADRSQDVKKIVERLEKEQPSLL